MGVAEATAKPPVVSPFRASLKVAYRRFLDVWTQVRHSKMALAGLGILVFFMAIAILAPVLTHYGPLERIVPIGACVGPSPPTLDCKLAPPSPAHPLGTSFYDMDIYSQVIWGTQVSFIVGVLSAIIASVVGTAVGLVSGYLGGWVDEVIMRFNDIVLSIPWLVLMIVVAAIIGNIELVGMTLIIGLTGWSITARVIRAQVLSVKERMFVERARMIGSSNFHIMVRHIFPNAFPLIFANTILTVAVSILSEAVLAFLGLSGINYMSWGKIIEEANTQSAMLNNAWWMVVPGMCIVVLVLGFYLFGYALDEILNPRLRRR
jgi:peptide/nickel transport system permease protein